MNLARCVLCVDERKAPRWTYGWQGCVCCLAWVPLQGVPNAVEAVKCTGEEHRLPASEGPGRRALDVVQEVIADASARCAPWALLWLLLAQAGRASSASLVGWPRARGARAAAHHWRHDCGKPVLCNARLLCFATAATVWTSSANLSGQEHGGRACAMSVQTLLEEILMLRHASTDFKCC